MSFKELYDHRQGLGERIELADIRRKLRQIIPNRPFQVVATSLKPEVLLGAYMAPKNEDTLFVGAAPGAAAIIVSNELNLCWGRFVQLKELMHLFDNPFHYTNNAEEFESLVVGMCEPLEPTGTRSGQIQSEYECMWMSLALVCAEERRVELQRMRSEKKISDSDVAELLKMPERFVPILFESNYKDAIAYLVHRR